MIDVIVIVKKISWHIYPQNQFNTQHLIFNIQHLIFKI
ncbi:hypothetical protein AO364_1090 [Moraxella catarrhalis]|nr:hypothetical protein AO364_1090 [Moraxella catarrhalis]